LPVSEEDFHGPGLQLGEIVFESRVKKFQTVAIPELKRKEYVLILILVSVQCLVQCCGTVTIFYGFDSNF